MLGPILLKLNDAATVYVPIADQAGQITAEGYAPDLQVDPATLATLRTESLQGPQAISDHNVYHSWQKTDAVGGPAGRYLVDDAGVPVYLVDPGINGTHKTRPDGTTRSTSSTRRRRP